MRILWVDDEIRNFNPHIIFLENEGIEVHPYENPRDAIKALMMASYDLILLDYRIPDMDGLQTLKEMKKIAPHVPIALVTMVEDKEVMEEALFEDVFDYIVKPVQPSQILALAKRVEAYKIKEKLMGKKIYKLYHEFSKIPSDYQGWVRRGRTILELVAEDGEEVWSQELTAQNVEFAKWVRENYVEVLHDTNCLMSHNLMESEIIPQIREKKVALFILDNFRMDQFFVIIKKFPPYFRISLVPYMCIIPSATLYTRNSFYAGLLPYDIERRHPGWLQDNLREKELFEELLIFHKIDPKILKLHKINTLSHLKEIEVGKFPLEVFSINFLDFLTHVRLEIQPLRDLTPDESSFKRFSLYVLEEGKIIEKVEKLVKKGYIVFLTTDHGWVEGREPMVVEGGHDISLGLRYKFGDSIWSREREGFLFTNLKDLGLPTTKGQRLLVATKYYYFVYSTDKRRFEKTYKGGIFHGGITLEEMCLLLIKVEV